MAQFLRVPSRLSRAVRHAGRVVCVGGPGDGTPAHELLSKYFGDGLSVVARLDDADASDPDALVFFGCDVSGCGLADIDALERLSAGRQVVCDLGVFASLFDDDVLIYRPGRFAAEGVVKNPAYFLEAFGAGDVLPWRGAGDLVRGEAFGWKAPQHGLRVALASYDGRILAVEKLIEGGRIAAIDLRSLDDEAGDGFRDLSGLLVLEAMGAEMVDLGHYRAPWLSYEEHTREIEAWASMHAGLVSVECLEPQTAAGRALRLVTVAGGDDKAVVLLSCCTHGHEWAPSYGVFGYLCWLVEGFERGGAWARTVLENLTIAWVPVVSADGFAETWSRGLLVPHGASNVDLNRNYPPGWKDYTGERNKGPASLSEPETQALSALMKRFAPRGLAFVDFHECGRDFFPISPPDEWLQAVGEGIADAFAGRYLHEDLGTYHRDRELEWVRYAGLERSPGGGPGAMSHAASMGFPHAFVAEHFGNDDFTPYQVVARTDASGLFTEHTLGGLLGRTAYNHRIEPRRVKMRFPELSPDEPIRVVKLDADERVSDDRRVRAGEGVSDTLERGERIVALAPRWKCPIA